MCAFFIVGKQECERIGKVPLTEKVKEKEKKREEPEEGREREKKVI